MLRVDVQNSNLAKAIKASLYALARLLESAGLSEAPFFAYALNYQNRMSCECIKMKNNLDVTLKKIKLPHKYVM